MHGFDLAPEGHFYWRFSLFWLAIPSLGYLPGDPCAIDSFSNDRNRQRIGRIGIPLQQYFLYRVVERAWRLTTAPAVRRRSNAKTQTWKKQSGSIRHRAGLHGTELRPGTRRG